MLILRTVTTRLTRAAAAAKRAYDELAERGEKVLTERRRHGEERPEPVPAKAPPGSPAPSFTLPDDVQQAVADAPPGASLAHDELPLADYDHLTLGSLRARLTKLDAVALVQLRDYERTHANRINVLTMLDNRLAKLAREAKPPT